MVYCLLVYTRGASFISKGKATDQHFPMKLLLLIMEYKRVCHCQFTNTSINIDSFFFFYSGTNDQEVGGEGGRFKLVQNNNEKERNPLQALKTKTVSHVSETK